MYDEIITLEEAEQIATQTSTTLRLNYSGRNMHGRSCIGFVGQASAFKLGVAFAEVFTADFAYDIGEPITDSMGYDTITYFPGLSVEVEDDDE